MSASRRRAASRSALTLAVGLLGFALVATPGIAAPAAVTASFITPLSTAPPSPSAPVCPGYSGLNNSNPYDRFSPAVYFTPGNRPAVRVGTGTSVNWSTNPYRDSSWQNWMLTLKWLGALVLTGNGRTIPASPGVPQHSPSRAERWAALDQAVGITASFLRAHPRITSAPTAVEAASMAHRTQFLACLIESLGPSSTPAWLTSAARAHAGWLANSHHYSGNWNVGMDQNLGVLAVGCVVGPSTLRTVALGRLTQNLNRTIDSEGVPNEQAPGYAGYQYTLWNKVLALTSACGLAQSSAIPRRIAGVPAFLSQATQPDGRLVQIGDTIAQPTPDIPGTEYARTQGRTGDAPAQRVMIYRQSGYVFGRSSWTNYSAQSFYTLRFGPVMLNHGHMDRTAVTWMVRGRDRLVDSGHVGYANVKARLTLRAAEAHNKLTADSYVGFRPSQNQPTTLVSSAVAPDGNLTAGDSYVVDAKAYGYRLKSGWKYTSQRRSVLVLSEPDLMVVRDVAGGGPKPLLWRQHWHLPVGWAATRLSRDVVEARSGSARTTLVRIPLGTGSLPVRLAASVQAPAINRLLRNTDVQFLSTGRSTGMITIIAPVPESQLSYQLRGRTLTIVMSGRTIVVDISRDGTLTRVA